MSDEHKVPEDFEQRWEAAKAKQALGTSNTGQREAVKLIPCPACENQCSPSAFHCPKCGHVFNGNRVDSLNRTQARKPISWKYLTIGLGVLSVSGLAIFAAYSFGLFSSATPTSSNATKQNLANVNSPSTALTTPEPKAVLEIETGIDYKVGGVQPITSTPFYLLDKDVEEILRTSGLKPISKSSNSLLGRFGLGLQFFADEPPMRKALADIKNHTKYSTTTNLQGKAVMENLRPDSYYVYGVAETRKGFVIWNFKTTINPGRNRLTLDTSNAALAF